MLLLLATEYEYQLQVIPIENIDIEEHRPIFQNLGTYREFSISFYKVERTWRY